MVGAVPGGYSPVEWDTCNNRILFNLDGTAVGRLVVTRRSDGSIAMRNEPAGQPSARLRENRPAVLALWWAICAVAGKIPLFFRVGGLIR